MTCQDWANNLYFTTHLPPRNYATLHRYNLPTENAGANTCMHNNSPDVPSPFHFLLWHFQFSTMASCFILQDNIQYWHKITALCQEVRRKPWFNCKCFPIWNRDKNCHYKTFFMLLNRSYRLNLHLNGVEYVYIKREVIYGCVFMYYKCIIVRFVWFDFCRKKDFLVFSFHSRVLIWVSAKLENWNLF